MGKRLARLLALFLAFFYLPSNAAFAHERWFISKGEHPGEQHSLDGINLCIVLGAVLFVAAAVAFQRSQCSPKLDDLFGKAQHSLPEGIEWRVVAVLTGIMLIFNALFGVFLAHNLVLPDGNLVLLGGAVQVLIGALLLSQTSFLIPGALILAVALPLAGFYFAPALLVDYTVELAALSLSFVFFGMSSGLIDRPLSRRLGIDASRYVHLPLPIIRVGVGATLVILALHNKLLNPDMALTFLDKHDFNFMAALGFTNLHFVFAAGVGELTMGILLTFGIATRVVAAGIVGLLITTMALLGPKELIGHLPLLGVIGLLVCKGPGGFLLRAPGKTPATAAAYP